MRRALRAGAGTFVSLMRRALTILLLLAIAGAAAWTLLKWRPGSISGTDPWRAVPSEAVLVIELPRALTTWDRFAHTSLLWRDWERIGDAHRLAAALASLTQRLEEDSAARGAVGDPAVLIALLRSAHGADPIFIAPVGRAVSGERIGHLVGVSPVRSSSLAAGGPLACDADSAWAGMTVCLRDGLLLASPSATAMDEALLQLDRGTPLTSDALFAQARATLGQATDAHVLVHLGRARNLLSTLWDASTIERAGLPDGWLALDLSARPDAFLMNGLYMGDDHSTWLAAVQQQGAGSWNVGRLLPADVVQWEIRHVGDADATAAMLADLDERTRATEVASTWMQGELGLARTADGTQRWLIAGCADPESAAAELAAPCAQAPCDTLSYRGYRLTRAPQGTPYEQLLGRAMELPHQPWWVILGSHAVLSDDPAALQRSIDVWNDGGSLAEEARAKSWFRRMSDEAGLTWWCDLARSGELLKEGLRADRQEGFAQWVSVLQGLGGCSVQLSPAGNQRLHVTIGLQHASAEGSPSPRASHGALWSCAIGAPVTRRPELVRNHTNNTLEALVQDTLNRIHLVSASGKLLWSRPLDGPIMGPVHQVDRFKNGKLQLLLNTARTVYLIDRNGKDVGTPYKLPASATAPLAVFDYEGTRDYRVLVGLDDGRLLNMDLDWAAVQGWDAPRLTEPALAPVHHLRIGGKDYLLVIAQDGSMRLLDRRGQERQPVKARLDRLKTVLHVQQGPQAVATLVTWVDEDLAVRITRLSSETEPLSQARLMDVDADGIPETIVAGNELPKGVWAAFPLTADSLAVGTTDPFTGHAWQLQAAPGALPLSGRLVVGDLNLDGAREAVGIDASGHLSAHRLP